MGRSVPAVAGGRRAGAVAGFAGAGASLAAGAVVHTIVDAVPFPPVAVAEAVVHATPGGIATFFIERLHHLALPVTVIAVTVAFALLSAALGTLLPTVAGRLGRRLLPAAVLLGVPLAAVGVAMEQPMPGTVGRAAFALGLIPPLLAGGWAAAYAYARLSEGRGGVRTDEVRRQVVRAMWLGGLGVVVGRASLGRLLFRRPDPGRLPLHLAHVRPTEAPPETTADRSFDRIPGLSPEITPNGEFYVVDEAIIDPDVDTDTWSLSIGGAVDRPYRLTYRQLEAMDAVEEFVTLECISNPVGGGLISTAKWAGVPVAELLDRAGVRPGAIEVVFRSVEGYSDALPIHEVTDRGIVAIGMNGHVLPRAHGYPARLIAPGHYGMKMPKWLGSIEVVRTPFTGYWEQRGWVKPAIVQTMSRIDTPANGSTVGGRVEAAGVAFAGVRGISRVEVSLDGGRTWREAELKRPLAPDAWRLWRFLAEGLSGGSFGVLVRAYDGEGRVQVKAYRPPHPGGATGYDGVTVDGG